MALLDSLGADLVYHDPYVPELPEHDLRSQSLASALEGADAAVIVTRHPDLDIDQIITSAWDWHQVVYGEVPVAG